MRHTLILLAAVLLFAGCGEKRKRQSGDAPSAAATETASEPVTPAAPRKPYSMPQVPIHLDGDERRMAYLAEHYWDRFDFSEASAVDSEYAEQAFVNYLMVLDSQPDMETARKSISSMMGKAAVSNDMFDYFAGLYEKYLYDPNSPYRNEELYIPVLKSVIANESLEPIEKVRAASQLEMAMKNRPGERANDFPYTTAQGAHGTLYGIKADYTLVFFYNLGCPACKEIREGLLQVMAHSPVAGMLADGRLKVLAIYPDEDMTEWDKYIGDIPARWVNAYDGEQAIRGEELYELRAIPSLYLLDRDKRVLLKDFMDPAMLPWAIQRNEESKK